MYSIIRATGLSEKKEEVMPYSMISVGTVHGIVCVPTRNISSN